MDRIKKFLFTNQTTKQVVIKNTFWIASSTILVKLIRAAIIIYAARLLGTAEYGIFTYAMSIATMLAIFSDMGISSLVTRELSKEGDTHKEYFSTAAVVKCGFILFIIAAIAIGGTLISRYNEASSLMLILACSLAFESTRNFLYTIARARNRMQTEAGLNLITEVFCTVLVALIFFRYPSPYSLAIAYAIGNAIGLLVTVTAFRKFIVETAVYVKRTLFFPILRASLPFTVMGIFGVLMTNIDAVFIGLFGNEHLLGLYGAAQRPINILYIIPGFLNIVFLPILSKAVSKDDPKAMQRMVRKTVLLALGIGVPLIVGGTLLAKPFINAAFGYEYVGAVLTFQILLWSILFSFPGSMLSDLILAENRSRILVRSSILGAIVNVILDLILIPRFGIAGSAVATLCSQLVANGVFFLTVRSQYRLHLIRGMKNITLAALGMGTFTFVLVHFSIPLLIIIPLGALVYAGLLFLLREPLALETIAALRG